MAAKAEHKSKNQRSATRDDVEIGWRIRVRRLELNLSQEQLGAALGVTFQQVQKYEKGESRIAVARFLAICQLLQVDPNYLLGWQGKLLKLDDAQSRDSVNLRMAQAIGALPFKLRAPVKTLVRGLSELTPADVKR